MPMMAWNDTLSVGIDIFDSQHQRLIQMINYLFDAMSAGHGAAMIQPVLDGMILYTKTHFSAEEHIMEEYSYPGYARHKEEHDALRWKVDELRTRIDEEPALLTMETLAFLKTWLTTHILGTDKQYTSFFALHGLK